MDKQENFPQTRIYHIRVLGILDEKWADWFAGFAMATIEEGQTFLTGLVRDQSELFGIISKLNSLGLPLLVVMQIRCPCSEKKCFRNGVCSACWEHYQARGGLPFCLRQQTGWNKKINRIV
jgi:hypothetical protein